MPRRCIVAGCSNTKRDGVSLHSFPFKDTKTIKIWTRNIRLNRQNWKYPTLYSEICSDHFAPAMFTHPQGLVKDNFAMRSNLIKGAVPTIFPSKLKTPSSNEQTRGQVGAGTASCSTPRAPLSSRSRRVLIREVG